jgi:polyhydroxyalkanoate synthase
LIFPSPERLSAAAVNIRDIVTQGHLADLRPMPRALIDEGPQRAVYRYDPIRRKSRRGAPVLLVPPLAAPSICFDLRRGCSLVEHLVRGGRPTYLVDYGHIAFADRNLGIEHWIEEVVPRAARVVRRDAGERPLLVGWSLGGTFALLSAAANERLPISGIAAIGSPFDITLVPIVAPMRPLVNLTGGRVITALYRTFGGAPALAVRRGFQLTSIDKYLTKPLAILTRLDDREFLEQIEAVDRFTNNMAAYPGRTFGQLYHRFFRGNDLAMGRFEVGGRTVDVANVRVPVLVVAGDDDVLAPNEAVAHLIDLLTGAPEVSFRTAPGGHLGVLTGRRARTTTWRHLDAFIARVGTGAKPRRRKSRGNQPSSPDRSPAPAAARRSG